MKKLIYILAFVLFEASYCFAQFTLNVTVPSSTDVCYVAGGFNGWAMTTQLTYISTSSNGTTKLFSSSTLPSSFAGGKNFYVYNAPLSYDYSLTPGSFTSVATGVTTQAITVTAWKNPVNYTYINVTVPYAVSECYFISDQVGWTLPTNAKQMTLFAANTDTKVYSYTLSGTNPAHPFNGQFYAGLDGANGTYRQLTPWGNFTNPGTGNTVNFTVSAFSAIYNPVPSITTSTYALSGFNYTYGTGFSSEQSFTLSALGLTSNLTLTPPTNYEISTGTGGSFVATNPITLTKNGSGNIASTTIYVRLKASLNVNNHNTENIVCTSSGANTKNVVCSGSVSAASANNTGGNISTSGISVQDLANTNLTISSGELVIDQTTSVNSITVAPNARLTLSSNNILTATNGITLQSDATGTATLVDNTTISPQAVTATVQQYLSSARNWYITPSVSGALVPSGQTYYRYDETGSNTGFVAPASLYWVAENQGIALDPRKGYIVQATGESTISFAGTLNTGSQTPLTLTRTTGKSNEGFNLVANPYPSYLNWNMVTKTNVSNTMWLRTKEGGSYKFYTYIANSGAGVGSPATVTNKIPPMQAFWVRVITEGTGSIAMDNNMRSHIDDAGNRLKAPSQTPQKLLRLQVSNGTNTDETVLYFNANASDAFDQYDAQKRSNNDTSIPEIFTQVGTEQLVINGMNNLKYNTEIPIGFSTLTAANNNNLSISASEMTNFETGTRVILIDKEKNPNVETELTNGTAYNFSAKVTSATTDRFSLLFRTQGIATDVDNTAKLNAQVFVNAANQITIIAPEKSSYAIYNAVGQKQYENKLTSIKTTINKAFATGVYFIALSANGQRVIQKVIIKRCDD